VGGDIFRTCPDRPWGPPSFLYNGYRVLSGGEVRPARAAEPAPSYSAVVLEELNYNSTALWDTTKPVTVLLYLLP